MSSYQLAYPVIRGQFAMLSFEKQGKSTMIFLSRKALFDKEKKVAWGPSSCLKNL